MMLEDQGRLDEALEVYEEFLAQCSSFELASSLHRVGALHWKRGAYGESLRHLDKAIEL
jgi:tetratricopeptide (TPR) repeat protein